MNLSHNVCVLRQALGGGDGERWIETVLRVGYRFPRVLEAFEGAIETTFTVASWYTTPQAELEGETPAAWMRARRGAATLYEAARRTAAKLAA